MVTKAGYPHDVTVIKAASGPRVGRGGGVETIPLITRQSAAEDNKITTGDQHLPGWHRGAAAPAQRR